MSLVFPEFRSLEFRVTNRRIGFSLGVLAALLGVVVAACGAPKDEQVKAAFLRENPAYTVTAVTLGEGDGSTVYKHIRYRRPGSDIVCEVVWGYQQADREWRIFYKGEPGLAGTVCKGCTKSHANSQGTAEQQDSGGRSSLCRSAQLLPRRSGGRPSAEQCQ